MPPLKFDDPFCADCEPEEVAEGLSNGFLRKKNMGDVLALFRLPWWTHQWVDSGYRGGGDKHLQSLAVEAAGPVTPFNLSSFFPLKSW